MLIWGMGPGNFTAKDYEDIGAKLWVTGQPNGAAAQALLDLYRTMHDKRIIPGIPFTPAGPAGERLNKLRGLDFWGKVGKSL